MKKYIILGGLLVIFFAACQDDEQQPVITALPVVNTITPATGQTGDTVIIDGANFNTHVNLNAVAVHGIPARVIAASADRITAIIPPYCQTGNLMVTVADVSVPGPVFTVIPSPIVTRVSPDYGFAEDTLTLEGYHFADTKNENFIQISGINAPVVKQQGDTLLKVIIPVGDGSGRVLYRTFNGQTKEYAKKFQLRKPYTGNLLEAIRTDPAFSYTKALLEKMKEILPAYYEKIESICSAPEPHTVFLRDNKALQKRFPSYTSVEAVRQNGDAQSFYFIFLWSTAKGNIVEDAFTNTDYPSELSEEELFGGPGNGGSPDVFIPITMVHAPGQTSVTVIYSDESKVTVTDLTATNGTIHQLE